jgi:hypothetical protein
MMEITFSVIVNPSQLLVICFVAGEVPPPLIQSFLKAKAVPIFLDASEKSVPVKDWSEEFMGKLRLRQFAK